MSGILAGVRVLDFGRYIAGPFCATLLADLGADVIRIEKPTGGEDRYTVPVSAKGEGAYHLQIGRNKRGMTLDPKSEDGQKIIGKLVETADVVLANLPYHALESLGLDYKTLSGIKPDIILTTMSAFGSEGPYAKRGGFDTIAQAMSGAMYLSGSGGEPARSFAPYCDFGTASVAAFGTLAALMHRDKTGDGQIVEGTLLGTALAFNNAALMEEALLAPGRQGSGTRGQYNAPSDTFRTKDGWVSIQVVGDGVFKRVCALLDKPEWLEDPRLKTDQGRGDHRDVICDEVAAWCSARTGTEAMEALSGAGVPCGQIMTPRQLLDDEHVRQAGMFKQVAYPNVKTPAPVADHPVRYSKSKVGDFRRAPTLSEHTAEILTEIGYTDDEISSLADKGVI
jgi:crotonobetainyl-CoA:carnitine CoA-transferase CaiB-like acyl-CoA transferase